MPGRRELPYGVDDEEPQKTKKIPPPFIAFIAVACTIFAGMGDWSVINKTLKGLPKAVALGTIACAFLNFLVDADFSNLKKAASYFPLFMLLIADYAMVSMLIWITDFTSVSAISGGAQRIFFQMIIIIYAICMCYLFETRAINFLFACMCAVNGAIMVLEMPKYGIAQSIISIITCVITFDNTSGYVRALEIHDITFLFGQFIIYFLMFAPKETLSQKRIRYLGAGLCLFFMLVGLKRSTLPAVALMCIYVRVVRMTKNPQKYIIATGIGLFLFFYVYLYLTRSGILVSFLQAMGVKLLGRDKLWSLPNDYYQLSPFWKGLGMEAVDGLISSWYKAGLITSTFPLHNDILRTFIELGAPGFTVWAAVQNIVYPIYWMKHHDTETGLLYMAIMAYMSVTYLTDNTAFYFWSSIGLRLIPMSYSYRIYKAKKVRRWKEMSPGEASDLIWMIETGEKKEHET